MNAFGATDDEPCGLLIMAWMRYGILCFLLGLGSLSAATHVSTLNELKLEGARDSLLRLRTTEPLANQRPEPKLQTFEQAIAPILKQHCVPCHGPEKTKAASVSTSWIRTCTKALMWIGGWRCERSSAMARCRLRKNRR